MENPSPKLTASAPVLLVKDVQAAANHYRDALGFSYERFYGEPPSFVILRRDGMYLMLKEVADSQHIVPFWKIPEAGLMNVYFWVKGVDQLYAEFIQRDAKIDFHLENKDHGCREFGIQDLDGYDIVFGEVLP